MAQYSNLTECFTDIATAIREVEGMGATPKIAPNDFASRIRGLDGTVKKFSAVIDSGSSLVYEFPEGVIAYLAFPSFMPDDDDGMLGVQLAGQSTVQWNGVTLGGVVNIRFSRGSMQIGYYPGSSSASDQPWQVNGSAKSVTLYWEGMSSGALRLIGAYIQTSSN